MDLSTFNKQCYRTLVELSPVGMFYTDVQGLCLFANKRACEICGLNFAEIQGEGWANSLYPADKESALANWHEAVKRCLPFSAEFRFQTTHGKITWGYYQGIPDLSPSGIIQGYTGTITDITHKKTLEEQHLATIALLKATEQNLIEAKEKLQLGLESAKIGVWTEDFVNNTAYWDQQTYQLFGITDVNIKPNYAFFLSCLHPADRAKIKYTTGIALANKTANFNHEYRVIHPNNDIRYLKEHSKVYYNNARKVIRSIGVVWDITDAKENELRLRQNQIEIADTARKSAMGEIASGLAHELNQPLTVIATYAQLCVSQLTKTQPLSNKLTEALEQIVKQAERAGNIIHRIKDITKQKVVYYEPTQLDTLITEAIEFLRYELTEELPKITLEFDQNLLLIYVDRIQLQQVIINLIRNSIEALQEINKSSKKIHVRTFLENNKTAITIADNGAGIPNDLQRRIFEPYFTTKKKGFGIGLAICRSIIESHGGQLVLCHSNHNKGTCFKLTLPL